MLSSLLFLTLLAAQDTPQTLQRDFRPSVECAEHLRDDDARADCLRDLLEDSEDALDEALDTARREAGEIDEDFPGFANARAALDTAHAAWISYRDAECARRAALLLMGDGGRDLQLDCQITLTRSRTAGLLED